MKTLLLSALVAMAAQGAMADDYKYLVVYDKDGNATDVALADLQKITFADGNMVLATTAGEQLFAQTALGKMLFAEQPTPVQSVAEVTKGSITYSDGQLAVGPAFSGETFVVLAANGTVVASSKVGAEGAAISVGALPHGVYVARVGQTVVKISK